MAKDLRSFLADWESANPHAVKRVKGKVDSKFEASAVLLCYENHNLYPICIFENILNLKGERPAFPVISNLFASHDRRAHALGADPRRIAQEYFDLEARHIKPVIVPKKNAPVKQVIKMGDEVDLLELPVLTHHDKDSGPFITAGLVTCRDPDNGVYNLALHQCEVKGKDKTGLNLEAASHNAFILRKNERMNGPTPVAITIGHHPAFALGAQSTIPFDEDEYDVIGGLLQESLELVPSEVWGDQLLVPARAEIVVEGYMPPGVREHEAPFGGFTGYYGPKRASPIIKVQAITYRADAIYHDIFVSHADNQVMGGLAFEAGVYRTLKAFIPWLKNVYFPISGCCRFHCYVQMKKEGEALNAIAVLPVKHPVKHIIVVDEDVDIFNEREVLWAVATRTQLDKDVRIVPGMRTTSLDPSAIDAISAKVVIDATKPRGPPPFAEKGDIVRNIWR